MGKIKITSATRFGHMKLDPGKKFKNYYWLEGPLPGNLERRITVLHYNQAQQCSYCLKTTEEGCQGMGQGKKCEERNGIRAKLSDYMNDLKAKQDTGPLKKNTMK